MCMDVEAPGMGSRGVEVDGQRGYGHPDLHAPRRGCQRRALRRPGGALIVTDVEVGAVRISATGWEGWILQGIEVRTIHALDACRSSHTLFFSSCGKCQNHDWLSLWLLASILAKPALRLSTRLKEAEVCKWMEQGGVPGSSISTYKLHEELMRLGGNACSGGSVN